jgi:hypothetical protein
VQLGTRADVTYVFIGIAEQFGYALRDDVVSAPVDGVGELVFFQPVGNAEAESGQETPPVAVLNTDQRKARSRQESPAILSKADYIVMRY